ncbi:uncharacterized protein LOC113474985 [Ciona intestinalis]
MISMFIYWFIFSIQVSSCCEYVVLEGRSLAFSADTDSDGLIVVDDFVASDSNECKARCCGNDKCNTFVFHHDPTHQLTDFTNCYIIQCDDLLGCQSTRANDYFLFADPGAYIIAPPTVPTTTINYTSTQPTPTQPTTATPTTQQTHLNATEMIGTKARTTPSTTDETTKLQPTTTLTPPTTHPITTNHTHTTPLTPHHPQTVDPILTLLLILGLMFLFSSFYVFWKTNRTIKVRKYRQMRFMLNDEIMFT